MTRRRWIGLILGIGVFLAAFGIALAVTFFQVSREIPTTVTVSPVSVLSSGDLGLYHDSGAKEPVTDLEFTLLNLRSPLRPRVPDQTIYIRNQSAINLTLIEPCQEVVGGGVQRIGFINPRLRSVASGEFLGDVCGRDVSLSPGEMVRADMNIHDLEPGLAPGQYSFATVFGAVGQTRDEPIQAPAGMVSWWPGDGHTNDIMDGNDGTLSGDAIYAPGMVGQAFSFDASLNEAVIVPSSPSLNMTEAITIDA